jgi:DNA mismatch repair protein MutS2
MEFLNENTKNTLDMDYIFNLISPRTPYGLQLKREMRPFQAFESQALEMEYEETFKLVHLIKDNPDIFKETAKRQSINRATEGNVLDEFEFFELKSLLFNIEEIIELQSKLSFLSDTVKLFPIKELEELFDPEGLKQRTFYIYDVYSSELLGIRQEKRELQRKCDSERKKLTQTIEELIGAKLKLSGEVILLKKDEEKLKLARACKNLVEGASTMLQATFKLKNNQELNDLLEGLDVIKQKESNEEYFIKKKLSVKISEKASEIFTLLDKLGKLDFFMARAEFSISIGGIRPILHCHDKISIKNGRHIKLEKVLACKEIKFSPISFEMHRGVTVITGANMGGKTVNLKLAGMLTAMAQYGLFVPAEEFHTCLFDYIYFSIGDMQSIDSGLSTFGSEISGMIDILKLSDKKGLILIDELARGTNPEEGYAISRAIVNYLKNTNSITLFTTHFDGISSESGIRHLMVKGLKKIDYTKIKQELIANTKETEELNSNTKGKNEFIDSIAGIEAVLKNMDYSLVEVIGNYDVPRDAINIARLMGLDDNILNYAEKILVERKGDNNGQVTS